MGLEENEEAKTLLAKIVDHTTHLTALWEQQLSSDASVPWWADGEYSSTNADRWTFASIQLMSSAPAPPPPPPSLALDPAPRGSD